MKKMIQKNKGRLICSAFVMCIGMILGYTCENSLWVNGTFAVTYVVAMAVTFYDNRNRQQSAYSLAVFSNIFMRLIQPSYGP